MHQVVSSVPWRVLSFLVLIVSGPVAFAQATSEPPAPDPAMQQLMRMATFLSGLKQFSLQQHSAYDVVQESGQKIAFEENRRLLFVRPDRFRVETRRGDGDVSVTVFDGKSITVFNPAQNLYATSEITGDIDTALIYFLRDLQMRLPLALLFASDLPKAFEQRIQEAAIVETTRCDGAPCIHLAARAATVDFQVWLPEQGDPLPHRIIITYKHEEGQPQYYANLWDWNLSPEPPASYFSLEIPDDAERIAFLEQARRTTTPQAAEGDAQ